MAIKEFLNPASLPQPAGFSQVVTAKGGKIIYISGQVAFDVAGQIVGKGDLRAQAVQAFENLKSALAAAGATLQDLVKINYYVVHLTPADTAIVRSVRSRYLEGPKPPASTLVGVDSLVVSDLLIEIEAVAITVE